MNLYLRLLYTWIRACFKSRIQIGDVIELALTVLPNDLDFNGHMNNGRYMTIVDLGLIEYMTRCGFLRQALKRGWRPVLGGAMIAFRRGLKPWRSYQLRFSVVSWAGNWSYMRFEFVHRGEVMAVGYAKGGILSRDGLIPCAKTFAAIEEHRLSPTPSMALQAWIDADALMRA
ncbi:MAG: thioesterase family protein [Paludibacterium sp.]|uniref:thioesterase family protein n=1 Tax=Paludibacterium sp. TaxID=1917523 RepID=UPI0025D6CE5D|nr:thioesterase family protein [Paludibacterium sp.]MBV8048838.1 thioesterase family protein [Paludibacterium sp.]MBV8646505.1 thioesterase family protein [Paludibacterium sp.]